MVCGASGAASLGLPVDGAIIEASFRPGDRRRAIGAWSGLGGAAYLDPAQFSAGFGRASLISAALCLVGGVLAAVTIRNPRREAGPAPQPLLHCGLDAPASRVTASHYLH